MVYRRLPDRADGKYDDSEVCTYRELYWQLNLLRSSYGGIYWTSFLATVPLHPPPKTNCHQFIGLPTGMWLNQTMAEAARSVAVLSHPESRPTRIDTENEESSPKCKVPEQHNKSISQ